MTPYELICDDTTERINDNCYVRGVLVNGRKRYEMWYVSDEALGRAMDELKIDLYILNKRRMNKA